MRSENEPHLEKVFMASYDIVAGWKNFSVSGQSRVIDVATYAELERWASDPEYNQQELCLTALKKKRVASANSPAAEVAELRGPFDPRTEVSADAKHIADKIVMHLWILFVALPVVLGILFAILTAK